MSGRNYALAAVALGVLVCAVVVVFMVFGGGEEPMAQSEPGYPELGAGEKLEDPSFGWYRPVGVDVRRWPRGRSEHRAVSVLESDKHRRLGRWNDAAYLPERG